VVSGALVSPAGQYRQPRILWKRRILSGLSALDEDWPSVRGDLPHEPAARTEACSGMAEAAGGGLWFAHSNSIACPSRACGNLGRNSLRGRNLFTARKI